MEMDSWLAAGFQKTDGSEHKQTRSLCQAAGSWMWVWAASGSAHQEGQQAQKQEGGGGSNIWLLEEPSQRGAWWGNAN